MLSNNEKGLSWYQKPLTIKIPIPIIELVGEEVVTYRIIPDYNVSNLNNESIATTITSMYQTPGDRLKLFKLEFQLLKQLHFDILLMPKAAGFYLTMSKDFASLIVNKLETIWKGCAIQKIDSEELKDFDVEKSEVCELVLRDYNFKSISTSKSDLYPLTNMMGITKDLQENEKLRIHIAMQPMKRQNWIAMAKDEMKQYKLGKVMDKEMSKQEKTFKLIFLGVESLVGIWLEFKMMLFESIFGLFTTDKKEEKEQIAITIDSLEAIKEENKLKGLTSSTTYKTTSEALNIKMNIISQSDSKERRKINMMAAANAYKDLKEDNEIIMRELPRRRQEKDLAQIINFRVSPATKNVFSDKEAGKLIQLPQKTLQELYEIDRIDTREVDIPKELQDGEIQFGIAEKQRQKMAVYFNTDKNIAGLPIVLSGPQNAGKTTTLKSIVKDSHTKAKYSNIYIDFIENCHNSDEVMEAIPEDEKVIIRLGGKEMIPAMAFNEVSKRITEDMDPWDRIKYANMIAEQIEYLINSVTDKSTGELTAPMLRYLHSACMVVFIRPGAKINDAFEVLRKWEIRNEYMRYAKYDSSCFDKDDDVFYNLEELHDRDDKGKIIGTRENLIVGITNRITVIKKNPYLKAMLKSDIDNDFDFLDLIEQGKSIFIQIPRTEFPNPKTKDILSTFFMSRIWLAAQLRENNKDARLCKIIFDEIHQVPTCASFLKNNITEFRRHRLGLIITCHYFKQFGDLFDAIKSAGTSYMLLAGTEKENLEKLRDELKPFDINDGLNLKPFTSLNIINYGNQYARFIAALPRPI